MTPFNGAARPSETALDSVPVWVHIYDVLGAGRRTQWRESSAASLARYRKWILGTMGKDLMNLCEYV